MRLVKIQSSEVPYFLINLNQFEFSDLSWRWLEILLFSFHFSKLVSICFAINDDKHTKYLKFKSEIYKKSERK